MKKISLALGGAVFLLLAVSSPVRAYVMQSTNYRMQFDSVNSAGGLSTSTNYRFEDTLGEIASGFSTSTSFNLYGGYQQMSTVSTTISMSVSGNVSLLPSIGGLSGGSAYGSTDILVSTNNSTGYSLQLAATSSPALTLGVNSFADYVTTVVDVPDFSWSIANTSSAFGFSASGDDVASAFLSNGSACNVGVVHNSAACWKGFSVTDFVVGSSISSNAPSYTTTTISMFASAGSNRRQPSGSYSANIVITAYAN